MATVSELEVVLRGDDGDLDRSLDNADERVSDFQRNTTRKLGELGREMAAFAMAAGIAIAGAAVYVAIEWESSFADVEKTVDGTDEQLAELEETLRDLATTGVTGALTDAHDAMAAIAAAAGSLGIATEDIDEFTQTVAIMSVATGMGAEELATWAARFANVTGMDMGNLPLLSDTLVTLENRMAATADEITAFAGRMANLGTFGFQPQEILAYGAAMASLGLNAELGSTNFVKSVSDMTTAVATSGPQLDVWADTAGLTADEFTRLAQTDGEAAFLAFLNGLRDLPVEEQIARLNQLGITSAEQQRTVMTLAAGYDTVTQSLTYANEGWSGNGAAMAEANAQADTTQGSINRMNNALTDAGITLGERFTPALADLAEGLANLLNGNSEEGLAQLADGFKGLASGVGSLVTGDENFDFQTTIDQWELGGLALQLVLDNVLDGVAQFFNHLRIEFYEGIAGAIGIVSQETWESLGLGPLFEGIQAGLEDAKADMAAIQFGDVLGSVINEQIAGTGAVQLDQPITLQVGEDMVTMTTEEIILNPEFLAEIDPLTLETLRSDIQTQFTTALASGDEAAVEALMPVALALEIPEAEAEVAKENFSTQASEYFANLDDLELMDFYVQPNLIAQLPEFAQEELRTQLYDMANQAIAAGDSDTLMRLEPMAAELGINLDAYVMNSTTGVEFVDPESFVRGTINPTGEPVVVDLSTVLQSQGIDTSTFESTMRESIDTVKEQLREQTLYIDLVVVPSSVDTSAVPTLVYSNGAFVVNPALQTGTGTGGTTVINSYGTNPYELVETVDSTEQSAGGR